jgi:hypothetical protein
LGGIRAACDTLAVNAELITVASVPTGPAVGVIATQVSAQAVAAGLAAGTEMATGPAVGVIAT